MMPRPALDAHLTLLGWEPMLSDHGAMGWEWSIRHTQTGVVWFVWDHWTLPGRTRRAQLAAATKVIEWGAMPDKMLTLMAEPIMKDTL
jgi:hypothetical protein